MIRIIVVILLVSLNASSFGQASGNMKTLDTQGYSQLMAEIDYSTQKWTLVPRSSAEPKEPKEIEPVTIGPIAQILRYTLVLVVMIAVILGFLYFFMADTSDQDQKISEDNVLDTLDPDHIDNIDPLPLLSAALDQNDYRLAMRLRYIEIIKKCSDQQLIDWRPEKTNDDYLKELVEHMDISTMRSLTRSYERIWFGNYDIDAHRYGDYATRFDSLIDQLSHK